MAEQRTIPPGSNVALTIAGSDSCGGAGIQADLKTFTVMRAYGCTAITAITAQNTKGVREAHVLDPKLIEAQIDAVTGDIDIKATKTGMLGNAAVIEVVAAAIKRNSLQPLVVDPVMVAKSGDTLIDDDAVAVLASKLLPLAAIVTPNRAEAARLLGEKNPIGEGDTIAAKNAAKEICKRFGAKACIVKGFKRPNDQEGLAVDIYFDGEEVHELISDWRLTENTHGSGCVFAAAITAGLANGDPIADAVEAAKNLVTESIRQCTNLGAGKSPVNPLAWLDVK